MLTEIVEAGLAIGATTICMEYESGRELGVWYMCGDRGTGEMISERKAAAALMRAVWEVAAKNRGKLTMVVNGKRHMVRVRRYDHFGENAFELRLNSSRTREPS